MTTVDGGKPIVIVDENGVPVGVADFDQIVEEGMRLAYRVAAVCDDEDQLDILLQDTFERLGETYRFVLANALPTLAKYILSPTLDAAAATGFDFRAKLREIAQDI